MTKKLSIKLILAAILLLMIGVGAVLGVMNYYQVSFTTLVNKVATRLKVVDEGQQLIAYQQRYLDMPVTTKSNNPYPRIFLTQLRGWDGLAIPAFYQARIVDIKRNRLAMPTRCDNKLLKYKIHCFLVMPNQKNLAALEQRLIDFRVSKPKVSGNYGNSRLLAMAYDIAKASPYFSRAASRVINKKIAETLEHYLILLDGESASLWHGRANLAASAFLLATVLETEPPQYQLLYRRAYGHFNDFYQAISATETWPEGYNYWINTRALTVIMALSAFAEQQVDVTAAAQIKDTIKRIGLWHIYLTRPDFKIEGWADEGPRIDLKEESGRVIDLIAQITGEVVFFEFAQTIRKKYGQSSYYQGYRALLPLFYGNSAVNSLNIADSSMSQLAGELNTSELFGKNYTNHLSIRSDWGDDATFITFRAGHSFTHHQNYDAGHFTLYKGAPLAVNATRYTGGVNTENRKYFGIRTIAKNSLLIQKVGEKVQPHDQFSNNVADGGQRVVMPLGSSITSFEHWQQQLYQGKHVEGAKLINYRHQPGLYTAITSDLTAAYNSNRFDANDDNGKVRRVERTLTYLERQDMVLVYDNIETIDRNDKTKWLLHTVNRPIFDQLTQLKGSADNGILLSTNNVVNIVNGTSTMRLDILSPEQPQTLVIGGDDYRFYVETDGDDSTLDGHNYSGGAKELKWYDLPQWRLEISPQIQELSSHYLVALQPRIKYDTANSDTTNKVLRPNRILSTGINAVQFDELLVLSNPRSDLWQFSLDNKVNTLAVFTDKAATLRIESQHLATKSYPLEHGFNYIALPQTLVGKITLVVGDIF